MKKMLIMVVGYLMFAMVFTAFAQGGILGLWGAKLGDGIDLNYQSTAVIGPIQRYDDERIISVRKVEIEDYPTINGFGGRQSFYTPQSGLCWKIGAYSRSEATREVCDRIFERACSTLEAQLYVKFKEYASIKEDKVRMCVKRKVGQFNQGRRIIEVKLLKDVHIYKVAFWDVRIELYDTDLKRTAIEESRKLLSMKDNMTSVFGKRFGEAVESSQFYPENQFFNFSRYFVLGTPKFGRVTQIRAEAIYPTLTSARDEVKNIIRILEQKYGRKMYQKGDLPTMTRWSMPLHYDEYGLTDKYIDLCVLYMLQSDFIDKPGLQLIFVDKTVKDTSVGVMNDKDIRNFNAL